MYVMLYLVHLKCNNVQDDLKRGEINERKFMRNEGVTFRKTTIKIGNILILSRWVQKNTKCSSNMDMLLPQHSSRQGNSKQKLK